jgi:hypothetical protein
MIVWAARVDPRGFPDFRPVDTGYIGGADQEGNRIWVRSWDITFEQSEEGDLRFGQPRFRFVPGSS